MLDGITISGLLGSYLITGLVLYACFSTNVNVVLFLKRISDYPNIMCSGLGLRPMRVGCKRFYCIIKKINKMSSSFISAT